ncbi:MAG TPA: ATP-binding protein [Nocardioidaceae bacterium]|nr:ATP-binding protein [Nocardioidaceae bacterium]
MQPPDTRRPAPSSAPGDTSADPQLPRLLGWLRPVVDATARVNSSIHRKLLFGFLAVSLLLVGMGALSLVVIGRMDQRMDDFNAHQVKASSAQQMLYDVTSQSHFRAMQLLQVNQPGGPTADWLQKIADAKADFVTLLDDLEATDPANADFYQQVRAANDTYAQSSARVTKLFDSGRYQAAEAVHLAREHPNSHVLEDELLHPFIDTANQQMVEVRSAFQSDRSFLTRIVIVISLLSVFVALILGFALAWAFILPVRKMQGALAHVTAGDFDQRVDVPNRDELGKLADDLNTTSAQLAALFESERTLSARLTETNASLARASEAKSRFLASVSHELRTPMNAILGFTDAVLAGVDGPLNDAQKESLGWVQRGGRDLLGLINEILDLSRIEAGKLVLEPQAFAPAELIESVVTQHRSLASQKGLDLLWRDSGAPDEVTLDRQRLRQILVNLVGNALKFTAAGEVVVEADQPGNNGLHIAVRDTGPGIDPSDYEAIFEEFRRVDDGAESGTGLGLAISRRLARAMGGDIALESVIGEGTVFHLTLPLEIQAVPKDRVPADDGPGSDAEHLLVSIDDDPSVAPLLQKMLAGTPYRVATASAETALSDIRRLRPAAVLLDLLMPDRAGGDVLQEIKNDPETRGIPVIVVSVVDVAEMPDLADGHLAKPISKDPLLDMLAAHFPGGKRT